MMAHGLARAAARKRSRAMVWYGSGLRNLLPLWPARWSLPAHAQIIALPDYESRPHQVMSEWQPRADSAVAAGALVS
jgi:hypothetical protein